MSISMGPFITCFISSAFLTLYLYLVLYRNKNIFKCNVKIIFWGMALILLRMAVPLNFPFTYTIYSKRILIPLADVVYKDIGYKDYMVSGIFRIGWLVITLLLLIRFLYRSIRMHTLFNSFTVENNHEYSSLFEILRIYKAERLKVAIVPSHISPAVTGILSPILIIPDNLDLSDPNLKYIIAHEAEHYKNHDLWLKLLIEIVSCVHWWNPFVYLIKKEFSLAMEVSNDALLIQNYDGLNLLKYADCIVKIAKSIQTSKLSTSTTLEYVSQDSSNLKTRIEFILNEQHKNQPMGKMFSVHLILITTVVLLSFVVVTDPWHTKIPTEVASSSVDISENNAYFVKTENGFELYADGKLFSTYDTVPEEFKELTIYQEGAQ